MVLKINTEKKNLNMVSDGTTNNVCLLKVQKNLVKLET